MKFYVGVTDNSWYRYLASIKPDEVNFWQPGGKHSIGRLEENGLFLFKLHAPLHFIAGGGYFVSHSELPLSLAWEAFGDKNGTDDFESLAGAIQEYRRRMRKPFNPDPPIGCIVLAEPFFFPEDKWIPVPDWPQPIVTGKTYDTAELDGRRLWDQVEPRLIAARFAAKPGDERKTVIAAERYGQEYLQRPRLGQGAFRLLVTDAYQRRCAITGEKTLPVLTAAHIKPYAKEGPHEIRNGLLLREDLHKLFDKGLITVTPDQHVEVSRRIRENWGNGRDYYALHGQELKVRPERDADRPSREFLEWHNEKVFVS